MNIYNDASVTISPYDEGLARAIAEARRDRRAVPHEEMREWFLRLEAGEFDAPPPVPRLL